MKSLVATVSRRDPFGFGLVGSDEFLGPTLCLLASQTFDSVTLLTPVGLERQRDDLVFEIEIRFPELPVQLLERIADLPPVPTSFAADAAAASAVTDWLIRLRSGQLDGTLTAIEPPTLPNAAPTFTDLTPEPNQASSYLVREPATALYQAEAPTRPSAEQCGILGSHPALEKAIETASTVATHSVPVLLQGETGTGKELFARFIHACSERSDQPFVAVNCGALPADLVESTLFGHKQGAFTGADRDQAGKFMEANGGTLFLDEVAELPIDQQPKLLRALQEGEIDPVGGSPRTVDVRVIAASHQNIAGAVRDGHFREDLYYRLAFAAIPLPALRERASDIPELAAHLLREWNHNLRAPRRLTPEALESLRQHPWPGNVRELQAVIGRSLMFANKDMLDPDDLKFDPPPEASTDLPLLHEGFDLESFIQDYRSAIILKALQDTGNNNSAAARILGITHQAVSKFVRRQQDSESDE